MKQNKRENNNANIKSNSSENEKGEQRKNVEENETRKIGFILPLSFRNVYKIICQKWSLTKKRKAKRSDLIVRAFIDLSKRDWAAIFEEKHTEITYIEGEKTFNKQKS